MQAKLPDVNSAINYYRTQMQIAYKDGNFGLALIYWKCVNALLPKQKRMRIDTEEYQDKAKEIISFECEHCGKKTVIDKVKPEVYKTYPVAGYDILCEEVKLWRCDYCSKNSKYHDDNKNIDFQDLPFYTATVPNPPLQLGTDRQFSQAMVLWFSIAMPELECKISEYRTEYLKNAGDEEGF